MSESAAERRCTGRCGRERPAEDFARDTHNADGFKRRCRECRAADRRDRLAGREQPVAAHRLCAGRCGRTLPAGAFTKAALRPDAGALRCRECLAADRRERDAAKRVMDAARVAVERVADDRIAAERATLAAASDELAELAGLPAGPLLQPGQHFGDREVRLQFIRERVERAPPGSKAEAADNCRRIMRAADAEVRELARPPFDTSEVFLLMADAADKDEGLPELGKGLRQLGWAP